MSELSKKTYSSLSELAQGLRDSDKKSTILFAHNGIGKTSLSVAFKDIAKKDGEGDTLYYNAFTEDLFYWDNDLKNDSERVLMFHRESHFFDGFNANEVETRIRYNLSRYTDFDFTIKLDVNRKDNQGNDEVVSYVTFRRMAYNDEEHVTEWIDNIKISRGEENIFKWCFFLSIAQMAIDKVEAYQWVKYFFIDDPISSLDDNNAILVANHLANLIKQEDNSIHTIISTHHGLFYNVICNELKRADKLYLYKEEEAKEDPTQQTKYSWKVKDLRDTPFFHHVALIKELNKAVSPGGHLYTYHFNMLRNVLEKTAAFHGYSDFGKCIKKFDDDPEEQLYSRFINILSHGNYSLFEDKGLKVKQSFVGPCNYFGREMSFKMANNSPADFLSLLKARFCLEDLLFSKEPEFSFENELRFVFELEEELSDSQKHILVEVPHVIINCCSKKDF